MAGLTISGLSSGIDTSSVINSLIAVAAGPQNQLKTQLNKQQSRLTAFQDINAKLTALQTAAGVLAAPATWGATTASSTDPSVLASGSATALAGTSTTLTVTTLAQSQVTTAAVSNLAAAATSTAALSLTIGGQTTSLNPASTSAADVAAAVNSAGLGVRAALVKTSNGSSVLQFSSTTTGASSAFTVNGLTDTATNMSDAQDALVAVGDVTKGGYTVSSTSNTFTDAIPGVTFTVSRQNATTTIGVTADSSSIATAVQALVTAANNASGTIGYNTAKGADLAGQSAISSLSQTLLGVISSGNGGRGYSSLGIGLNSTGTVTFDANAFATAYAKDPAGTQTTLQLAMTAAYSKVTTAATDTNSGVVGAAVTAENAQIASLNKQISTWDTKLADQKTLLTTKYAAMEAALSKMKSQSSYLTSVFNAMNGTASSSSSSSTSG
jgi:flagellar hook-associated protein 2